MIRLLARHPTAANLLMIGLIAMGVMTMGDLRRETFPDFAANELEITVVYPGASAEEIEEVICRRLEDALDGVAEIAELRAEARENVGVVTVEMSASGDFISFREDVKTEIDAIDEFPDDAEDPIIRELGQRDMVMALLVTGPMQPADLKAYCEDLKVRLQALPDVSLVEIDGFSDHQFRVELDARALQALRLSAADVADRIERQSVDLPAGILETADRDLIIRIAESRRTPDELESLVIVGGVTGAEVRLGEIGSVVDTFEVAEDLILLGGQRAGLLNIKKTKAEDTIRIASAVKTFLEREAGEQPPGVDVRITQDVSALTNDRIQMLVKNGIQGLMLVFLTMWIFFNLRLSFWVAIGLPVSFLGAFYFLPHAALTINMLTLVGLLLALGLLMDDAIVIAENVATHRSRGKDAIQSAIDGTAEVQWGVISSFLTTCAVLGPLMFITGDIGRVLRVVPMILLLTLAVSLIEAFCILPSHLGHSLAHTDPEKVGAFRQRFDRAIEWVRLRILGQLVDWLLQRRYLTFGVTLGIFVITVGLLRGGIVKFQAFPDLEGDVIEARLLMPQGTTLERTEGIVERLLEGLDSVDQQFTPRQPAGQALVRNVMVRFNRNADAFESGAHVATISVDLLSAENRVGTIDEFTTLWRENVGDLPDVLSLTYKEPVLGPAGRAIEVQVSGDDLDVLAAAADELESWYGAHAGVINLATDLRPGKEELRLSLRPGALGLGFDAGSLARQVRAAYQGITADEVQVGPESYEVDVRLARADRDSLGDLEGFYLSRSDGAQIPLSAVAEIERTAGWSRIARIDRRRTVSLRGDIDTRFVNNAELLGKLQREFLPELQERYPSIGIDLSGEAREQAETQGSMMAALLIGSICVFILLSFQFRSYVEPLIVMVAIPFALIGVVWAHLLFGLDLSMPSILGFVSLAGIVVNDSILLVLFLKEARRQGHDVLAACGEASRARFRAVALTSLTTVAGLLPLLSETSLQAQILIPLATSIVGGILVSTFLVLLVIPCLYAILGDFGLLARIEESA